MAHHNESAAIAGPARNVLLSFQESVEEDKLMKTCRIALGTALTLLLCVPAAWAQQTHVVTQRALDQAVQQRVTQDQADRDDIRTVLQNPAVRDVAARAGLPIAKAEAAVATLQGDELHRAAGQARAVNEQLAGGSD